MASALDPVGIARWWQGLAREVVALPATLARARRLLVELPATLQELINALEGPLDELGGALPDLVTRIDKLSTELVATRQSIDRALPELTRVIGGMDDRLGGIDAEITRVLSGLDVRLGHMDDVVSDLGGAVTGVIGAIPGVRRTLKPTPT